MSRSEQVLYSSLIDVDALEQVFRQGLPLETIPTPSMRPVVEWSLDYFDRTGQRQAPSREALVETWGQVLEDEEVEIENEDVELDDIHWAIMSLKAQYALWRFQNWQKEAAETIAGSSMIDRLKALEEVTGELSTLTLSLRDRTKEVEGIDGLRQSLVEYERRADEAETFRGMAFGIPEIDEYTFGIHDGELCVLAAGPKTGKSVICAYIIIREWRRRRRIAYYTLENSVEMTYDRIACISLGIDHDRYKRGKCMPEEIERFKIFLDEHGEDMREYIHVIRPQRGQKNVQWITRHARSIRAQSMIIDQLTHMEASHRSLRGPDKVEDIMHDLKEAISEGPYPIPTILVHQINREGMKEAKKSGFLEMHMLAGGSEVERTADQVVGLYASPDEIKAQMMKWQTMAFRREKPKSFRLVWRPWVDQVEVLGELEVA